MFTIGCDPEFFISDATSLVSAVGKVDGTKDKPLWLPTGSGLQYDNVALEFCSPVCMDVTGFVTTLRSTFQHIRSLIPFKINCLPSAYFPEEELQTDEAKEFGCEPDYNVWERKVNDPPDLIHPTFRTCGGHVHVGAEGGSPYEFLLELPGKEQTIKAMDLLLGLTSLCLDNSEEAIKRRTLYGKAGSFRPKSYGVEYRTLSNFWLKSPVLVNLVYSLTRDALELVRSGGLDSAVESVGGSEFVTSSINTPSSDTPATIYLDKIKPFMSEESTNLFEVALNYSFKSFEEEWNV